MKIQTVGDIQTELDAAPVAAQTNAKTAWEPTEDSGEYVTYVTVTCPHCGSAFRQEVSEVGGGDHCKACNKLYRYGKVAKRASRHDARPSRPVTRSGVFRRATCQTAHA